MSDVAGALQCPAPTQGPLPCPTTTDDVLDKLRRILPRGIAWISVFDPTSVMYGYFRGASATYCWFTNECCLMLNEMFCALVTILGIFGHHSLQDGSHFVRDFRVDLPRVDRRDVLMMVQLLGGRAFRN